MEKEEFIIKNLAGNIASKLYEAILQFTERNDNVEKETHTLFNKVIMELYNHYQYK